MDPQQPPPPPPVILCFDNSNITAEQYKRCFHFGCKSDEVPNINSEIFETIINYRENDLHPPYTKLIAPLLEQFQELLRVVIANKTSQYFNNSESRMLLGEVSKLLTEVRAKQDSSYPYPVDAAAAARNAAMKRLAERMAWFKRETKRGVDKAKQEFAAAIREPKQAMKEQIRFLELKQQYAVAEFRWD